MREINAAGTTIILTTHYLEEAEALCRNIAIIDHGEIIENTAMKTLLGQLQVETFVLNLAEPLAAESESAALPALDGYPLRLVDSTTLEADVSKDRGVSGLFSQLSAAGIEVLSLRNKANRLEELFVRLVSRQDNDETADTGAGGSKEAAEVGDERAA